MNIDQISKWDITNCYRPCILSKYLIFKVMVSGSEVFGKWLSHEGRTLRNGISALMEEAPESSLSPSFCYGGHREKMPNSEAESRPFSSVQSLSCAWLFATPWIAARQASLSNTNSRSSPRLTSIESVMPSSHLILWHPLLLFPQSLPPSESFPMSQLFARGGQSTGVSALASFLPKNTQGWSPLEWTAVL